MKKERNSKIIEIVRGGVVGTQDELVDELKRSGYDVSQATISRDIKELRLQKTADAKDGYRYVLPGEQQSDGGGDLRLKSIFSQSVVKVDSAQNIVVIKTMPGLASAACAAVDGMHLDYVLGTLQGDDTGLVIVRDEASARELCTHLEAMCEG